MGQKECSLDKWKGDIVICVHLLRQWHHVEQSEHRLWSLQNKRVDTFCNYPAELVCRASLHSTVHTLRVFPIKTNKTFEDSNTSSIIDNIRFKAAANTNGLLQSMNSLQQLLTNFDDVVQQRWPRGSTGQWQVWSWWACSSLARQIPCLGSGLWLETFFAP